MKDVIFRHVRRFDIDGAVSPHGGATVCIVREPECFNVGFAFCSLNDTYYKKEGRNIAYGKTKAKVASKRKSFIANSGDPFKAIEHLENDILLYLEDALDKAYFLHGATDEEVTPFEYKYKRNNKGRIKEKV